MPLPLMEIPPEFLSETESERCCKLVAGRLTKARNRAREWLRHQHLNRPSPEQPKQYRMPLQEDAEVVRHWLRCEVDEDVIIVVRPDADRQLVGEVAAG